MASYRIGIGSFNLKDGAVGIGTESTGLGNLKVEGTIKTTDLDVGVSTFTRYSGFEAEQNTIIRDQTLSGEYSTTGDIVVDTDKTLTVGLGSTACIGSVECISVKHHFSVPVGDTAQRDTSAGYQEGVVRYNRDLGTMEFFNGNEWRQFTYISDVQNSPSSRGRGLILGGYVSPASVSNIESIEISTGGNAVDFGSMNTAKFDAASSSSSTRGISGGGSTPTYLNEIEYTTIASSGNGIDFGDLNATNMSYSAGCSSSTRGMFNGGFQSSPAPHAYLDDMNYVEIATLGDAFDFANLSVSSYAFASCSSSIRGFVAGGDTPSGDSQIQVYKIANKSNTTNFGDLSQARFDMKGCSSTVRGVFGGGRTPSYTSTIDYVTMASEGNSQDFGDLLVAAYRHASCGNQIRGLWMGGNNPSGNLKTIQSITFSTTGNAIDFGEISFETGSGCPSGYSDSHGGLGGY
jgi:hypothetical protein